MIHIIPIPQTLWALLVEGGIICLHFPPKHLKGVAWKPQVIFCPKIGGKYTYIKPIFIN